MWALLNQMQLDKIDKETVRRLDELSGQQNDYLKFYTDITTETLDLRLSTLRELTRHITTMAYYNNNFEFWFASSDLTQIGCTEPTNFPTSGNDEKITNFLSGNQNQYINTDFKLGTGFFHTGSTRVLKSSEIDVSSL